MSIYEKIIADMPKEQTKRELSDTIEKVIKDRIDAYKRQFESIDACYKQSHLETQSFQFEKESIEAAITSLQSELSTYLLK